MQSNAAPDMTLEEQLGPALARAFADKGYTSLTTVQEAVLDPAHKGRDLRISSQTGSGKTVALGLVIRDAILEKGPTAPRALVIEPTRELAKQVEEELAWLFGHHGARVASVTGGASYRDERHALAGKPAIVVATPGRLLDHLSRGGIDAKSVKAVVLDEADRLLDMGFREDLETILSHVPEGRSTHLVSATFPRDVQALADKVQSDPVHVMGTQLGVANADIEHIVHLVDARDRLAALINLLLAAPDAQTLVFARTRADVAQFASELDVAGFSVRPLSGEMQQSQRERALAAFKRGELHALIATDVAARGIDVQDISRVIQLEPPTDADTYTHRSGRTGRAGRKGTAVLLVSPPALARTRFLLRRAGVNVKFAPVPNPDEIKKASIERVFEDLTGPNPQGFAGFDDATWGLAKRLAASPEVARTIARLLAHTRFAGVAEPRPVRTITPPDEERPRAARSGPIGVNETAKRAQSFVPFQVTWGREHGADPRRLLALMCRRGEVDRQSIGAIQVGARASTVEVAADVAGAFAARAARPDARDDRVRIFPVSAAEGDKAKTGGDTRPKKPATHKKPERRRNG
jgi:ATP-dependent RNA helicase DeaD